MKGTKHYFSFYIFTIIFLILVFSCSMEDNNMVVTTNENVSSLRKDIDPHALDCSRRSKFVWVLEDYEAVSGKKLGFNVHSFTSLNEMRDKNGFSYVKISNSAQYNNAKAAGFDDEDIVATVNVTKSGTYTYPFQPSVIFTRYYVDEPSERGKPKWAIDNLASEVYPMKLLLSSYKIGDLDSLGINESYYNNLMQSNSNIFIMSDNYFGPWDLGCTSDQRVYWVYFKIAYGSRNQANWISLLLDGKIPDGENSDEFSRLFSKANSLGLKEIWLFIGNASDDDCGNSEQLTQRKFNQYLPEFLFSAQLNGWLKRYDRRFKYVY